MIVILRSDLELALHSLIRLTDHFQRFNICSRCLRWTWRLDARAPSGILFQNSNQVHSEISTCAHAVSSFVVSVLYLWPFFTHVWTYKFSNINTSFFTTFEVHKMFTCHSAQNVCDSWAFEAHFYNRLIYSKCKTQHIQPGTTTVCTAQLSRRPFSSTRRKLIWSWPQALASGRLAESTFASYETQPSRSWTWDSSSTPWAHMAMAFVPWNKRHLRIMLTQD